MKRLNFLSGLILAMVLSLPATANAESAAWTQLSVKASLTETIDQMVSDHIERLEKSRVIIEEIANPANEYQSAQQLTQIEPRS